MAEETDLSRTEPASPQRLLAARRAGDVPRSTEWSAWLVLLTGAALLSWIAPRLLEAMQQLMQAAFRQSAQALTNPFELTHTLLWMILPGLIGLFVAAMLAPMLLRGWLFVPDAARFDGTRIRAFHVFSRLGSADAGFDVGLVLLKLALFAGLVVWAVWHSGLTTLHAQEIDTTLSPVLDQLGQGLLILVGWLSLSAALDAGWRWWRYRQRHAMTWQEVLAEAREAEISPEIRAQMRDRQQQAGASAKPGASPHPNPPPQAGEGAKAEPKTINEVIG